MTDGFQVPPRVAVILVNWNGWADCIECLDTLWSCDYPAFDVFLVDNASEDDSVARIVQWCAEPRADPSWQDFEGVHRHSARGAVPIPCVVYDAPPLAPIGPSACAPLLNVVRSGGNLGFAGGNNVGMRAAGIGRYTYFWLLNTDTVIHHRALHCLVQRATSSPRIGQVGSTLRYYRTPGLVQAMGGARMDPITTAFWCIGTGQPVTAEPDDPRSVEKETAYVVGASMLVSAVFVREIGYMQEDYFLYFEEPDWAWRGRNRFKLAYAPDSVVYHKVGGSSAEIASLFALNLLYRNRVRFMTRFLPDRLERTKRDMWRHMLNFVLRFRFREALLVAKVLRDFRSLSQSTQPVKQP